MASKPTKPDVPLMTWRNSAQLDRLAATVRKALATQAGQVVLPRGTAMFLYEVCRQAQRTESQHEHPDEAVHPGNINWRRTGDGKVVTFPGEDFSIKGVVTQRDPHNPHRVTGLTLVSVSPPGLAPPKKP